MRLEATRAVPVELSGAPRFAGRVRRLAAVSLVALGAVWWLSVARAAAPAWASAMLLAGWWTMPALLGASLARPGLRVLLVIPSTLVTFGLLGVLLSGDVAGAARVGWQMLLAGILLGDLLGLWFWLRLAPAPAAMDDPFAPGRWAMIGVHVALVLAGIALAAFG